MSELFNKKFENYFDKYNELSDVKKDKLYQKFKPINLKLKDYDYDRWFTEEEKELEDEEELHDLPPVEGDKEEVKEGNKLLTRLLILLAQIKAGNNS